VNKEVADAIKRVDEGSLKLYTVREPNMSKAKLIFLDEPDSVNWIRSTLGKKSPPS
jgi:hypothetical protein